MTPPPGPRLPSFAQTALWLGDPTRFLTWCQERHGDVFTCSFLGLGRVTFLAAPADVRAVFLADADDVRAGEGNRYLAPVLGRSSVLLLDGAAHLRARRLLSPSFHGDRLSAHTAAMATRTARAARALPRGEPLALLPALQALTLDIILATVFGLDDAAAHDALRAGLGELARVGNSRLLLVPKLQVDLGPRSPWGRIVRLLERTDRALFAEIEARRARGPRGRTDVLSLLLQARDDDGRPMADAELRDTLVTLLLAGHETTAKALAFAIELLLSHPAALARAEAEVQSVLGGRAVEPADVPRLPFLEAVSREALRLYPVIPNVSRRLRAPMRFGPYDLPAKSFVAPAALLVHRRADTYPEPLAFRPERWLDEKPDPYAFLAFGGGTRRCVGMAFSLWEMRVVLATLLQELRLSRARTPPTRAVLDGITLSPAGGARVRVEPRA